MYTDGQTWFRISASTNSSSAYCSTLKPATSSSRAMVAVPPVLSALAPCVVDVFGAELLPLLLQAATTSATPDKATARYQPRLREYDRALETRTPMAASRLRCD